MRTGRTRHSRSRSVDVCWAGSAGDAIPPKCEVIEVRVAELRQLFNAIDPSPFRERDLDPRAEAFIVDWSQDLPTAAPLALVVHLERAAGRPDEAVILREAIHEFFAQRAATSRRHLRQLFRRGRISLAIGLAFLASSIALGDALSSVLSGELGSHPAGKPAHRRLGGDVAAPRSVSVRLVAHSTRGSLARSPERDAGQDRVDRRTLHRTHGVQIGLRCPRAILRLRALIQAMMTSSTPGCSETTREPPESPRHCRSSHNAVFVRLCGPLGRTTC